MSRRRLTRRPRRRRPGWPGYLPDRRLADVIGVDGRVFEATEAGLGVNPAVNERGNPLRGSVLRVSPIDRSGAAAACSLASVARRLPHIRRRWSTMETIRRPPETTYAMLDDANVVQPRYRRTRLPIFRLTPPAACRRLTRHGVRRPSTVVRPSLIASRMAPTVRSSVLTSVTARPTIGNM